MTRKKVKLAFIANDSSRKATFKKRKKGLMKKVNELSTLCGITACAIIYSPYDTNPEVWPSNSGVQRVIAEFRTLPEMDQHKKMVDQETFLRQRIAKATEHLKRQRKENRELEMTEVMFHCLIGRMGMFNLNIMDLNDLGYLIDQYLKDVNRKIEILQNSGMEIGESSNAAPAEAAEGVGTITVVAATTAPAAMVSEVGSSSSSAAAATFFNSIQPHHQPQHQPQPQPQQQFRYPAAPHVGFYEQPRNLSLNQNQNQTQQQWFMELMNHPEHMSYMAEQMGLTFMDDNHHNRNHHHLYHHHQRSSNRSPAIPSPLQPPSQAVSSPLPPTVTTTTNRSHNSRSPTIPPPLQPPPAQTVSSPSPIQNSPITSGSVRVSRV